MQIIREDWWATPIWFFDIPSKIINPTNVEQECYSLRDKSESAPILNVSGWQSQDSLVDKNTPNIHKLFNEIEIQSKSIFKEHGIKNNINVSMGNPWININYKTSTNDVHIHGGAMMSGVYYVKASQDSGDIMFYGDPKLEFYNSLYFDIKNKNTHAYVTYKPIVGRVLIFPPWLPHSVETNNSNDDRISIGFNFMVN
jgi:uncharacterized protein (TIGR02466 family)